MSEKANKSLLKIVLLIFVEYQMIFKLIYDIAAVKVLIQLTYYLYHNIIKTSFNILR